MTFRSLVAVVALALSLPAAGQPAATGDVSELAALRKATPTDKRTFVASQLGLTPVEAKRFWPIYDNYQRHLDTTVRRNARLVEEIVALDRPLTDTYAKRLAQELIAIEDEEAKDRRRLHNQLMRVLPPAKTVRYLQIENKARALRQYEIAAAIPVVK